MSFLEIFPNSYPHLILADELRPLAWDYGRMFNLMTASHFVRITARGMQFSENSPRIVGSAKWNALRCDVRADALCEHNTTLMFFPNGVVDIPPNSQAIQNIYTSNFPDGACTNPHSKRLMRVNDERYEVSLCDLVDANLDVVYDTVQGMLYWRQDTTLTVEYILISMLGIYFMSCISGNAISVASKSRPQNLGRYNIVLVLGVWLYMVSYLSITQTSSIVTHDDLALCLSLMFYVATEGWVAWHNSCLVTLKLLSGISIYTACLMLLAFRIHNTFDNPYNGILTMMFGTRSFIKYFSARFCLSTSYRHRGDISYQIDGKEMTMAPSELVLLCAYVIGDGLVFGILLYCGIKLSSNHLFDAIQQQVVLYVTCILLAVVVSMHGMRK